MAETRRAKGRAVATPAPSTSGKTALEVREPALFFLVFAHRHLPDLPGHRFRFREDPRLVLLEEVDRFAAAYGLEPWGTTWPHERAREIDLVALDRARGHRRFVNLGRVDPVDPEKGVEPVDPEEYGRARTSYQCLVYAHHDALIVQIGIGKLEQWRGSFGAGWDELFTLLEGGFTGAALARASARTLGASAVYWAMCGEGAMPMDYEAEVAAVVLAGRPMRRTDTDLGPLWLGDVPIFANAEGVSQDRWVLMTGHSKEAEELVNQRYSYSWADRAPDFAVVALARHKVAFERQQFDRRRDELEHAERRLDRRARWIIDTQRYHGTRLGELRRLESLEFQEKLARAQNNLADYIQTAEQLDDLRRTVEINRANFLINCVALVSDEGADRVAASAQQEKAAERFLPEWGQEHREDIFQSELGRMHGLVRQLHEAIGYADRVIRRQSASLQSGLEQLRIAGERTLGEISAYHALEAAAVVASVATIVVVELLQIGGTLEERPWLAGNLILLAAFGSFAIVQMLAGPIEEAGWLRRLSVGLAVGVLLATLVTLSWDAPGILAEAAIVFGGGVLGVVGHWLLELRSERRRTHSREREEDIRATVEKLVYAREELPDLLEDLPPATTYRVKDEASLLEKIERKNASRARELGITVDELRDLGQAYSVTDIGDAIGIRFVVPPGRIAEVVERVKAVTRPQKVEYKNVTAGVPSGRYRGFRSNYKSIHIDVDLWGVGARKDVNLVAEIQVRTGIQDLFANWFHDLMYKEHARAESATRVPVLRLRQCARAARADRRAGATSPWVVLLFDRWHPSLNRPVARALIWLSDVELYLFHGAMEWPGDAGAES